MLINWDDSYSIHNARIDEQHKKLFELAKKAYLMGNKYASREEIRAILAEFFEYMKVHFFDEEVYMSSINYPDLEDHKKLHKQIIQDLSAAIVHIKTVNDMKERLVVIAQEWLLEHILYQDMLIEKYRVRICAHPEETSAKVDAPKEVIEEKGHAENIIYRYTCGCPDKIHTVSQTIHEQLQRGEVAYRCKTCGKRIVYTENSHGN